MLNLLDRIDARVTTAETMGVADLNDKVDFTLAFAMIHEFPDAQYFFSEKVPGPANRMLACCWLNLADTSAMNASKLNWTQPEPRV